MIRHTKMLTLSRCALLSFLVSTTIAVLGSVKAQANDRDLCATPVPAAACVESSRTSSLTGNPWREDGYFSVSGGLSGVSLRCPLPVNQIELSGSGSDNDLARMRVHYRDSDGSGVINFVFVALVKTSATAAGAVESTTVCTWESSKDGSGATGVTKSVKECPHDIAAGAFYHFIVVLQANGIHTAQFLGIDFP
jgi:hypothetical protein